MPGLFAHNLRSDKRQHGNCCLSEEAANELSIACAENHWVVFPKPGESDSSYYTSTPAATHGIPHNYIPGVHSVLNNYCDFIKVARKMTGRETANTVDSIMCLPFSPWSQALRPDVEPTADASMRTNFREEMETTNMNGRAFLVDSTPEDYAIVKEPQGSL